VGLLVVHYFHTGRKQIIAGQAGMVCSPFVKSKSQMVPFEKNNIQVSECVCKVQALGPSIAVPGWSCGVVLTGAPRFDKYAVRLGGPRAYSISILVQLWCSDWQFIIWNILATTIDFETEQNCRLESIQPIRQHQTSQYRTAESMH
jgi:hypothetical protein